MRSKIVTDGMVDSLKPEANCSTSRGVAESRAFRVNRALVATGVTQSFNILTMLFGLVSVPLYLEWLGEERYGLYLTGLAYGGFLMFADAGLSWSSMLLISQAKGRGNSAEISSIVRTSISLASVSGLMVMLIVSSIYWLLCSKYLLMIFPAHTEFPGLFLAVGISTVLSLCFSAFYNVFIGLQEGHIAAFYQGSGRLVALFASLFAAKSGASLGVVLAANVTAAGIFGVAAALHCVRRNHSAFQNGVWWNSIQLKKQIRTGLKSFAMQLGNVLTGSAPVIAISRISGTALVPAFTVPLTLLNTPLSLVQSLNANMQASYGEAVGAKDQVWIASTVAKMLRQTLLFLSLLVSGFLTVSRPFIELWTGGRLIVSDAMQCSVVCVAACLAINSIFRFALSGMNQHRLTGISEICFGLLSVAFATTAALNIGPEFFGFGIVVAFGCTSGWLLPSQLSKQLGNAALLPSASFLLRLLVLIGCSIGLGKVLVNYLAEQSVVIAVLVGGIVVVGSFSILMKRLLKDDFENARNFFQRFVSRIYRTTC